MRLKKGYPLNSPREGYHPTGCLAGGTECTTFPICYGANVVKCLAWVMTGFLPHTLRLTTLELGSGELVSPIPVIIFFVRYN